jgi:hypothetical protein
VRDAIANNTVQRMQEKEQRSPQLSDAAPKPSGSEESRFIRSGAVGGWRNRLSDAQVKLIEQRTGRILERMGYPVGGCRVESAQAQIQSPAAIAAADPQLEPQIS